MGRNLALARQAPSPQEGGVSCCGLERAEGINGLQDLPPAPAPPLLETLSVFPEQGVGAAWRRGGLGAKGAGFLGQLLIGPQVPSVAAGTTDFVFWWRKIQGPGSLLLCPALGFPIICPRHTPCGPWGAANSHTPKSALYASSPCVRGWKYQGSLLPWLGCRSDTSGAACQCEERNPKSSLITPPEFHGSPLPLLDTTNQLT